MAVQLTNEALSDRELQWRIIYSVIVAGKSARFAENAIRKLFGEYEEREPFEVVRSWDRASVGLAVERFQVSGSIYFKSWLLEEKLRLAKTGNYGKLTKTLTELAWSDIDLRTCLPADLEKIHGIGPKTSRFFILWTRPDARCAALDVHILRWLGEKGYKVPKNTPQSAKAYAILEKAFLDEAEKLGLSPAELDKQVWMERSGWTTWNPETFVSDKTGG
jgi:hypothetical protein